MQQTFFIATVLLSVFNLDQKCSFSRPVTLYLTTKSLAVA